MSDNTTAMAPDPVRTGLGIEAIKRDLLDNLFYIQARFPAVATPNDYYQALSYTVRDRLLERWVRSAQTFRDKAVRTVCYLSRSEEHTSELQSLAYLVCRLLLEKKKKYDPCPTSYYSI